MESIYSRSCSGGSNSSNSSSNSSTNSKLVNKNRSSDLVYARSLGILWYIPEGKQKNGKCFVVIVVVANIKRYTK